MTDSNWIETKQKCLWVMIPLILLSIGFFISSNYGNALNENQFIKEHKILKERPVFKKETVSSGKDVLYIVELYFIGDNKPYYIYEPDYNFLKNQDFIAEIDSGDTLSISRSGNSIHFLSKKGKEYLDYHKMETNTKNINLTLEILSITLILICIFIQYLEKQPTFKFKGKIFKIKIQVVIIVTLIITYTILKETLDFKIIFPGEFIK